MDHNIVDVVRDIVERADEAKEEYSKDKGNNLEYGRLLAFCEVLSSIKAEYSGVDAVENAIDFDIDKKYLIG